jgi:hypothetical protein
MCGLRVERLPLTYDECRTRFRQAAAQQKLSVESYPIAARGPDGQELTIDVARLGAADAQRVLVVLSAVHGVEGFVNSLLQADLLLRWSARSYPDDLAVLLVHGVNPWGMAWWRRQNESNVDLNRNWRRDDGVPFDNAGYPEVHHLACPDTPDLPKVDGLLAQANELIATRGLVWVRDAITTGQYRHPDGLHYGGERTEASNRILERVLPTALAAAERVLIVDLHTGHGPRGEITALSDQPPGAEQDVFLRAAYDRVEATVGNPEATTGPKAGQIANGLRGELDALCFSTSLEIGTSSDIEQLIATYHEQWVYRRGDRRVAEHAAAVWAYRCCFTPDDPQWEAEALRVGREFIDRSVAAVASWS